MTDQSFQQIAEHIRTSDLPRKERKLDGLRAAHRKRLRLTLVDGTILLDDIAVDPSELENGHWL